MHDRNRDATKIHSILQILKFNIIFLGLNEKPITFVQYTIYSQFLLESMNNKESLNLEAVLQTLDILSGKWRIPIVVALRLQGKCRFKDLMEKVDGIGTKMLSKELKNLEDNGIIQRLVQETTPVVIEYELTLYGQTLDPILDELSVWGNLHLKKLANHNPKGPIGHFNTIDI